MSELKPCPWCGGYPEIGPLDPDIDGDGWAYVACKNIDCPVHPSCEVYGDFGVEDNSMACKNEAIRLWNHRPTPRLNTELRVIR